MMFERYALEVANYATKKTDFWIAQATRTLKNHTSLTFCDARVYIVEHQDYEEADLYKKICMDFVWTDEVCLEKLKEEARVVAEELDRLNDKIRALEHNIKQTT